LVSIDSILCRDQPTHAPTSPKQLKALVNMMRVTGRFESKEQQLAPWAYGDEFDVEQVPQGLRHVLEKIQVRVWTCVWMDDGA
jgi:hypothetical protein